MQSALWQAALLALLATALGALTLFFHPRRPMLDDFARATQQVAHTAEIANSTDQWVILRVVPGMELPAEVSDAMTLDLPPEEFELRLESVLDVWRPELSVAIAVPVGLEKAAATLARRLEEEGGICPVYILKIGI